MKKYFSIAVSALIPVIAGMILSFLLLFIEFYTDEMTMEIIRALPGVLRMLVVPLVLLPPILSGVLLILAEIITGIVLRKKNILSKKGSAIALLIGAVIYAPLTICFLEYSLTWKFMYQYLPARELAADWSVFFYEITSVAAALICCIYHLVMLVCTKKSSD